MRKFNWTNSSIKELKRKIQRWVEIEKQYDTYCQNKDVWFDDERYEKYVRPVKNDVFEYIHSLGFTETETEASFWFYYDVFNLNNVYNKITNHLSSIINKEAYYA